MAELPERIPAAGYYYHYKHDPSGPVNNYAYYVFGAGHHTEEDCRPQDAFMQVYLPLYEDAYVYKLGKMFDLRPLGMAVEDVEVSGKRIPRFARIEDPSVIDELRAIRSRMYPDFW